MAASKDAELGGNQVFRLVTAGTWQEEENTHDLSSKAGLGWENRGNFFQRYFCSWGWPQ